MGALYTKAIVAAHDSLGTDFAAIRTAVTGSADESTAAHHLSEDFQALLDAMDKIPFPPSAKDDLSALKKTLVALQIFWSNVAIDTKSYSDFVFASLNDANNQAELVLGHDVGVSLVITPYATPTPTP